LYEKRPKKSIFDGASLPEKAKVFSGGNRNQFALTIKIGIVEGESGK